MCFDGCKVSRVSFLLRGGLSGLSFSGEFRVSGFGLIGFRV